MSDEEWIPCRSTRGGVIGIKNILRPVILLQLNPTEVTLW